MAAPIVSVTVADAYNNAFTNVHSLAESSVDLQLRLAAWRATYFDLLDTSASGGAIAREWVAPTLYLENTMIKGATTDPRTEWLYHNRIIDLLQRTLFAVLYAGYTPDAPTQATIVTAFNAAWT